MFTVFITGPLAGGKQTACKYLATKGFLHIDLDAMAKELLGEDEVISELVEAYGSCILDENGLINNARLAEAAFVDENSSQALNSITWPRVTNKLSDIVLGSSCQLARSDERLVVEVAMLAESGGMLLDLADTILCVTADPELRRQRAIERGMNPQDVDKRMRLQASDEERNVLCDVVIQNNGSTEELHRKLDKWLVNLMQEQMF